MLTSVSEGDLNSPVHSGICKTTPLFSSREIKNEAKQLPDLLQHSRPNIAPLSFNPPGSDRTDVLTLSGRCVLETIGRVGINLDFRGESPKSRRERYNLNNTRFHVQDPLGGHHYGGMTKPGFGSCWQTKIQIDDITRGQHRANQPLQQSDPQKDQLRSGPDEGDAPRAQRCRRH